MGCFEQMDQHFLQSNLNQLAQLLDATNRDQFDIIEVSSNDEEEKLKSDLLLQGYTKKKEYLLTMNEALGVTIKFYLEDGETVRAILSSSSQKLTIYRRKLYMSKFNIT